MPIRHALHVRNPLGQDDDMAAEEGKVESAQPTEQELVQTLGYSGMTLHLADA